MIEIQNLDLDGKALQIQNTKDSHTNSNSVPYKKVQNIEIPKIQINHNQLNLKFKGNTSRTGPSNKEDNQISPRFKADTLRSNREVNISARQKKAEGNISGRAKEDVDHVKVICENEKKYKQEIEHREKEDMNNKIKESKEKNLKSIMKKFTTLSEFTVTKKVKIVDFIITFLILCNLVVVLIENDIYTNKIEDSKGTTKQSNENNRTTTLLRWIVIGIIILIEILLIIRYQLKLKLLRCSFLACSADSIFSTGLWKGLIIEFVILGVFSPPGMTGVFTGRMNFGYFNYSYNSIITFFVLFKLYYLVRIYANLSIWASDRVVDIGVENKISIGAYFAMKAQITQTPYIALFFMLSLSISLFGFMLRIFEYGYLSDSSSTVNIKSISNPNFQTYTDTFWVTIITMMTIGFGDIYPNTHLGRVISFLSAVVGMLIVSFLILSLSYLVEFSSEEKKAHNMIKKLKANEKLKNFSSTFVKSICRLYLIKTRSYDYNNFTNVSKFKCYLTQLLVTREIAVQFNRFFKYARNQAIPSDEILLQLQKKLLKDSNKFGPKKFMISDITESTKRILEKEKEINSSINYLKDKQYELAEYLVKFNSIHTTNQDLGDHSDNNSLLTH